MSLEQSTDLYASVLRQLLPEGVYDTAEMTHVADDIYAHAKALAQADIDAHRLLQVLETIPVDLLADYEREYGLPMQCMVPGSQTIEERINVLRWIRQHRNVMNREYLEQILAIFGVTLVDVVKHYPMQCTAPCNSPVNTERLRYKVLLRLQYPMTADMSCIIESYLPGYLRVEWVVDMPWGEWILNNGYSLVGNNIRYTAYKTNQRDFYDSYADFDLITALVRSFHDTDMQQWQGFKDAVNILTGVIDWVFDPENNTIKKKISNGVVTNDNFSNGTLSGDAYCLSVAQGGGYPAGSISNCRLVTAPNNTNGRPCVRAYFFWSGQLRDTTQCSPTHVYTPPEAKYESIPISNVATQLISNLQSLNQGTSLLAEAYIETVINSMFNLDESKQFVKLSNLLPQFELNKILRT